MKQVAVSGSAGVWVVGLLVAAVIAGTGWFMLQPPEKRRRWWSRLRAKRAEDAASLTAEHAEKGAVLLSPADGVPRFPPLPVFPATSAMTPPNTERRKDGAPSEEVGPEDETRQLLGRRRRPPTNATLPVMFPPRDWN